MIPRLCCLATVSASLGLARVTIIRELSHTVVIDAPAYPVPDYQYSTGGKSLDVMQRPALQPAATVYEAGVELEQHV